MKHADEINSLIAEALTLAGGGNPESAIWRLVDAAGLLAEDLQATGGTGLTQPTGRGYRLMLPARKPTLAGEVENTQKFLAKTKAAKLPEDVEDELADFQEEVGY